MKDWFKAKADKVQSDYFLIGVGVVFLISLAIAAGVVNNFVNMFVEIIEAITGN